MKKILYTLIVILAFSFNCKAQDINWLSLNEALELQKTTPKKILMDVYTTWCGPCKMLDKNTFQNEDVSAYINEHYYAVKFNGEGNEELIYNEQTFGNAEYDASKANSRNSPHDFARYLQISAYPTIVFFDETGNLITPLRGYQTPAQIEIYLKMFKNDHHKTITSQEEFNTYYENFKPEFKG
ncbi:thioredoxin fold domain-containing protein [Tamlana sp. 62-3]|uniref:Thioredoxin fold domain-containing protein n=1 Tax=Neotamlana sargassicola TaxID=2883125 RepID=A0A9X1I5G4_9FLAO|nr:thioredoxin fold domain-containing protein [Tamlana sargassicola]MCB4808215.1 thioredoxin fold domain-containing protein [Tamlana sargassicola]